MRRGVECIRLRQKQQECGPLLNRAGESLLRGKREKESQLEQGTLEFAGAPHAKQLYTGPKAARDTVNRV